jgi:hypothetical protein
MKDIEVKWHARAQARIAPRNADDLSAAGRSYWHCKSWAEVKTAITGAFQSVVTSEDADLLAAAERIKAWTDPGPPKTIDPLDLQVLTTMLGADRIAEWAASHFGAAALVPVFARPQLSSEWGSGGRVLARKKGEPETKVLRKLLVRSNAAARAEARAAVQPLWDEGDVKVHEDLAYAFFFDEDFRKQALAEILDQKPVFDNAQLTLARDEASTRALLAQRGVAAIEYTEIVASLGADALPILLELAPAVRGNDPHLSHALALSVLLCEESAHHLSTTISHPTTRDLITEWFTKHTALAKKALPLAATGASRNAALAKALLVKIAGPPKEEAESLVGLADPAIPQILRDAPWRDPKPAIAELGLDLDAWPVAVDLPEARKLEGLDWWKQQRGNAPTMTPDEAKHWLIEHGKNTLPGATFEGKCIPEDVLLERWNAGKGGWGMFVGFLAKFGARGVPGFRAMLGNLRWIADDILRAVDDPQLAVPLLHNEQSYFWWHLAHPRSAAVGLLAAAHRDPAAVIALRRLARAGHEAVVLEVAEKTKDPAAVRAFLARDRRLDVVKIATATSTHGVSRPRLKDGRALADDAICRILEMLAMSPHEDTYAGIDDVRAVCDPRSLAEMAWDLAALADGNGVKRAQSRFPDWMRWSLRHLGDDEVIRRITPALKHSTVYAVLESLAREGDRAALIELATAQEREDVNGALQRVAVHKNVSADELVETMLPTTQLEPEGTTSLVYGHVTLKVGFDTTLAPVLYNGEKRLASLPRAKPSDDPVAIRLAKERWDELKEDVRTIAHLRVMALENAMRTARRISAPQFVAGWATHPLGKHQARGVVWAVERPKDGKTELVTFHVAEDSTFADIDDHELVLQPSDFVRVPHPAELGPDIVNRWTTILGDYGLMQPVAQLARTPLAITDEELAATKIERDVGHPLPWNVYNRIAHQQHHSSGRPLTRGKGFAQFDHQTTWANRQYSVTKLTLTVKIDDKPAVLSTVDPIELAESLFVMRLLLEAE